MSGLTLVRVWKDYSGDPINAFVNWRDGRFTIPTDHPAAETLMTNWPQCRLTVYSTDELEWHVDTIDTMCTGLCRVTCVSHLWRLRSSLLSDDDLIGLWLEAEGAWHYAAERDAYTEELARDLHRVSYPDKHLMFEGYLAAAARDRARQLIESGWRKGDPT